MGRLLASEIANMSSNASQTTDGHVVSRSLPSRGKGRGDRSPNRAQSSLERGVSANADFKGSSACLEAIPPAPLSKCDEKVLYDLGCGWVILRDPLQWIIGRVRKGRKKASVYEQLGYVGTDRDIVLRCLREHGAPASVIANAQRMLPERRS
jgi:hypothetical protein